MSALITQIQLALRARHYSRRTEQTYCQLARLYIRFHGLRHPAEMAEPEINAFVTYLAVTEKVSASTRTQALSAILFRYRHVLHREVGELTELVRAQRPASLPVVLTREEVRALLDQLDHADPQTWLIAPLLRRRVELPDAVQRAGIANHATCCTLRRFFATHLLKAGHDIRTIQERLGHRDVDTTMICTHVLGFGAAGARSPLDHL